MNRCTVGDEPWREALRNTAESGSPIYNTGEAVLCARRKNPLVANVAIARELAGWCWSLATLN
jgi:transposase